MRVLVACEFSGIVREAFSKKGHDAWSCDLLPTEIPGNHYQADIFSVIEDSWDLMICHPPCTHLAVSGSRWFKNKQKEQQEAISFVKNLLEANINKIALENPISILSTKVRKPDQIINPYDFGHDASKKTCLWLKNLPLLTPTNLVLPRYVNGKPRWSNQTDNGQNKLTPSIDRWKNRSRTYEGIAAAMAEQWG